MENEKKYILKIDPEKYFINNKHEDTFDYKAFFDAINNSTAEAVRDPVRLSKYCGIVKDGERLKRDHRFIIDYINDFHDTGRVVEYLKKTFPDTSPDLAYEELLNRFHQSSFADYVISTKEFQYVVTEAEVDSDYNIHPLYLSKARLRFR